MQATVHPFLCYCKEVSGNLTSIYFTIISENKDHDTVAVHLFQKKLIKFLTDHFSTKPTKIMYVSDRCAGQYNFKHLCHHKEDFDVVAEWHLFATAHGKSGADAIGEP